jgi:NitT/TauT family transport system ATP-binding protein
MKLYMPDYLITAENLSLGYPVNGVSLNVSSDFNWSLKTGSFHAIIGPSGCGKSTLLRAIAGLEKPISGRIERHFSGTSGVHDIAMAFQSPTLLPWLTVEQNALLPFTIARMEVNSSVRQRLDELLELVALQSFKNAYPHQLSGGMQMRAALVRTFITESRLMLMDEPFAALDELNRERLCSELERLWISKGRQTVVFVTHNIQEAIMLADSITVLSDRPFRLVGDEITVTLPRPRSPEIRVTPDFISIMTNIRSRLDDGAGNGGRI